MDTTRRQFLEAGALGVGALLAAKAARSADNPAKWRMGLGLNGFMSSAQDYHKEYPLWEVLQFAVEAGFPGVELVEGWPQGGYPRAEEEKRVAALRGLYDRYGLRIYSFQNGGGDAHAADPERRKRWLEEFTARVRLAKLLGCDFIGHWPGGGLEGNAGTDAAIGNLVKSYRDAASACADAGLYMSFEIEPPFVFNTPEHLERILAEVDHPACKTNYDQSHFDLMWGSKGRPAEMLKRIGAKHIGHVHLTDTDGTLFGGTSKHIACGDGHCGTAAALQVLYDGGYQGWVMVDAWKIEDPYDACRKGKKAVDDFWSALP